MNQDALTSGLDTVNEAKALFKELTNYYADIRKAQMLDMDFITGKQWTVDEMQDRENNGRPCFTMDRISPTVNLIVNAMLQNIPAIEVSPNGDGAEVETAEIIANMIRGIEQESNAPTAYGNAGFYQVAIGEGYFRVGTRYIDEASFDQEIQIKPIDNPFTVLYDPNSVEPDGKDADVVMVVKDLSPYEYKNRYGKSKLAQSMASANWANSLPGLEDWASEHKVRVVEYWKRVYEPKNIYLVETLELPSMNRVDVQTTDVKPSDAELDLEYQISIAEKEGFATFKRIINTRESFELKVMQYLVNGVEVLSKTEFPGRYIPIIPVRGDFLYSGGQRHIAGVVRSMRDPQKVYNLQANAQLEAIALAPKAPFIGYPEQIEGYEGIWEQANSQNFAFLPLKKVPGLEGVMPQRMNAEPAIQAIAATRASFAEDLKAVSGVYDAALGQRQGEESGKAILARQQQTETTNWKYSNNLKRAIKQAGRIIVDVIPHFYDTERMVKIVKPTGEAELLAINTYHDSPVLGDINQKKHDLTVGKYDVVVNTGKAYSTQRQEAVDSMMELVRVRPDLAPLVADLVVKNMDWDGAKIISKRLRADLEMKMPGLLQATGEAGDDEIDPEIKAAQMQAQSEQLKQALEQAVTIGERLQKEVGDLKQDNQALRTKAEVDLYRAELDSQIKLKQLELDEQKAIQEAIKLKLDYQIKLMQAEQEKARTEVQAVRAAAAVSADMFEREQTLAEKHMPTIEIDVERPDLESYDEPEND